MDQQSQQLIAQLQKNPALLRSVMQSQDGQALMQQLTAQDGGTSLQKAVTAAAMGKPNQMMEMMSKVMASPAGADLVQRINQSALRGATKN